MPISLVWFSLKSSLSSHLNPSNRIINEQVMAKIRKLIETGKAELGVPVHPEHVPVHFGLWWGVPVHPYTFTGTPSEICPDLLFFATFSTN